MVQTLLLVKHFSQDEEAKRSAVQMSCDSKTRNVIMLWCCILLSLAGEAIECLGVKRKQPDPGYWTVRHVSFWMENNMVSWQCLCSSIFFMQWISQTIYECSLSDDFIWQGTHMYLANVESPLQSKINVGKISISPSEVVRNRTFIISSLPEQTRSNSLQSLRAMYLHLYSLFYLSMELLFEYCPMNLSALQCVTIHFSMTAWWMNDRKIICT